MNFRTLIPNYIEQEPITFKYKFTVFTPVYNCESTIERVHKSLENQTYTDFEWVIINDGSTDNSHDVILDLTANTIINVRYFNNKNNQHKIACFMQAIGLAKGEFLLTFDADDECLDNALEVFYNAYNDIPENLKENISAVTALCTNQYGDQIGDDYPKQNYVSNTFKTNAIDKIFGEKWGFTKTNILRGLSYTEAFINSGFMPEGLIWNLLSKEGFQTKYINIPLRIYYTGLENSISSSGYEKTALGTATLYIANFNWFFNSYFYRAPIFFIKNLFFLIRITNYLNFNLKNYTTSIDSPVIKFFFVLLWPIRKFLK